MNGEGNIPHDCFRAGGGNLKEFSGGINQFVADFIKFSILRLHHHLFIRESSQTDGAPIYHAFPTVNITILE